MNQKFQTHIRLIDPHCVKIGVETCFNSSFPLNLYKEGEVIASASAFNKAKGLSRANVVEFR